MFQTFVEVLLDQNLSKRLDYAVPEEWASQIEVGMRVEVPLKKAAKKATVVRVKQESSVPNVRRVIRLLSSESELSSAQWKLAHWMSRYYAAPLQRVLKCFIPPNVRKRVAPKTQTLVSLHVNREEALKMCGDLRRENPQEAALLEALLERKSCFAADLSKELGVPMSIIARLVKKKVLSSKKESRDDLLLEEEFFKTKPKTLNDEQKSCFDAICQSLSENRFAAHLIHGVTGSGKTEIYLQAITRALEQNKSAILLVPEISLTSQTIAHFRARFSEKIAILHHKRSLGERSLAWEKLKSGEIRIVVGARSAIFAPVRDLGLIIVDEEHDGSYKQGEEAPFYHARNVAVMRASLENAVVLLGSATPSVESRYNADIGKYRLHRIAARASNAPLPKVTIVDMKKVLDKSGGFTHFSEELLQGIKERCEAGEQSLLFLNRRGYHRLQICSSCRATVKCPHCDLGLTFHRGENLLRCHLCDYRRAAPRECPACNASGALEFKGFGTEHVERVLHALFPDIRTLRMDRDTTQRKESHEEIFKQFRAHKADVLIGTQMIAKGFHFPSVTLVGVLNADAPLSIPDFRSAESVFQLLIQVAGRSGRLYLPGEVILQTFLPDHPVLKLAAAQDYETFYKAELEERRLFGFPPFTHLVKCLFSSPDMRLAEAAANEAHVALAKMLPPFAQAFPPSPSGHPKIKDQYRFQFLIKSVKIDPLIPLLQSMPQTSAQVKIDIDPLSTFF
jgi:primosomal protein N' (replication factor Y) (superfamily II helicase)